jgi:hypothetical protein
MAKSPDGPFQATQEMRSCHMAAYHLLRPLNIPEDGSGRKLVLNISAQTLFKVARGPWTSCQGLSYGSFSFISSL